MIRLGNGVTLDPMAETYVRAARLVNWPGSVSFYWFMNMKAARRGSELAERFVERAAQLGGSRWPLMMDIESVDREGGDFPKLRGVPWWEYLLDARRTIELATQRKPIIYANRAYWNGIDGPGSSDGFNDCPLMCARYPFYSEAACARHPVPHNAVDWERWIMSETASRPQVPIGWADWDIWQFSAGFNDAGPLYGASSEDLDLCLVREQSWDDFEDVESPVPVQPPIEVEAPVVVPTHPLLNSIVAMADGTFVVVANSDDPSNPKRYAWNGAVLIALRSNTAHERFIAQGFFKDGKSDLTKPVMMTAAELGQFPLIE